MGTANYSKYLGYQILTLITPSSALISKSPVKVVPLVAAFIAPSKITSDHAMDIK